MAALFSLEELVEFRKRIEELMKMAEDECKEALKLAQPGQEYFKAISAVHSNLQNAALEARQAYEKLRRMHH